MLAEGCHRLRSPLEFVKLPAIAKGFTNSRDICQANSADSDSITWSETVRLLIELAISFKAFRHKRFSPSALSALKGHVFPTT